GRIEIEVGVDVADPAAARLPGARLDRVPLAQVPVVVEDADVRQLALEHALGRSVDRAVGHDDHLEALPVGQSGRNPLTDRADVVGDRLRLVVDGNDHRQGNIDILLCRHDLDPLHSGDGDHVLASRFAILAEMTSTAAAIASAKTISPGSPTRGVSARSVYTCNL